MLAPDQLNDLLAPLFPGLMGVRVVQASPDEVRAEMLVRPVFAPLAASCTAAPTWRLPTRWARSAP